MVILSFLLSSGLVTLIITLLIKRIDNKLTIKYQEKFDEKLESFKSTENVKNHITKEKFNLEINIYKTLLEKYYDVVYSSSNLISVFEIKLDLTQEDQNKIDIKKYNELERTVVDA